jgi:hypothetical protein
VLDYIVHTTVNLLLCGCEPYLSTGLIIIDEPTVTEIMRHSATQEAERGIRYALVAVLIIAFRQRNLGAVVNAVVAIAGTYLPSIVEDQYNVEFVPWQRTYTATAMLTHAIGMLGPYEDTWWWDHLTHTHSATLLAGVVHVASRRCGKDPRPRVLAVVGCVGLLWELMEYAIHAAANRVSLEPILVSYGEQDTVFDLCFDILGALVVLALGDRFLQNFMLRNE